MSSEDFYIGRPVFVCMDTIPIVRAALIVVSWFTIFGFIAFGIYEWKFIVKKVKEYEIATHNNSKVLLKRKTLFGTKKLIVQADDLKTKSKYLLG